MWSKFFANLNSPEFIFHFIRAETSTEMMTLTRNRVQLVADLICSMEMSLLRNE